MSTAEECIYLHLIKEISACSIFKNTARIPGINAQAT